MISIKKNKRNNTVIPLPVTEGSALRRLQSLEKAKKVISYNIDFSLDDGLKATYKWYMNNIFTDWGVPTI